MRQHELAAERIIHMFCTGCGTQFGNLARFCVRCGAPKPEAAPLKNASTGKSFFSRLGGLLVRSSPTEPDGIVSSPVTSTTQQVNTWMVDPSTYGISNDQPFAQALLTYERAFRAYYHQSARCQYEKVLAWAAFNVFVSVKNGLLQRWHETGELDHRLYAIAQKQPIDKYRKLAEQDGANGPDDARKLEALATEWDRASDAFSHALDVRLLRIDGDIAAVRAEYALAEKAIAMRRELARNEMQRRNDLYTRLEDSIERRRVLAREEAYAQRNTEAERIGIENGEIQAITDALETLASGHGKATDTAEHVWWIEVRAVSKGAEVEVRKAARKAASNALKAERAATARASRAAPSDQSSLNTGRAETSVLVTG